MMKQKLNKHGIDLLKDNGHKFKVEHIGTIALNLESGYCLKLFDTVYILFIGRNQISCSRPDKLGYSYSFDGWLF